MDSLSTQVEESVCVSVDDFVKTNCSKYAGKRFNAYKRKWRKINRLEMVPTVTRQNGNDNLSSLNTVFDQYEESIPLLLQCRGSVKDRYKLLDETRLKKELQQYASYLHSLDVEKKRELVPAITDATALDHCLSTSSSEFLELLANIVSGSTSKCQMMQRVNCLNTRTPTTTPSQHRRTKTTLLHATNDLDLSLHVTNLASQRQMLLKVVHGSSLHSGFNKKK